MDEGVEIQFADGPFVVDKQIASLVREATGGEPQRYPRKEALKLIGPLETERFVRDHFSAVKAGHFRNYGG